MGGQGEGAADEAIESNVVAHGGLQLGHGLQHDGNTSGLGGGQLAAAGNALVVSLEGVAGHGGRVVLGPHQIAAQDFRLQLEVKHDGHAVGTVEPGHFHQALIELLAILEDLFSGIAFELAGVNTGKRYPGHPLGGLMTHSLKNQFFSHIARFLSRPARGETSLPCAQADCFRIISRTSCRTGSCRLPAWQRRARNRSRAAWSPGSPRP